MSLVSVLPGRNVWLLARTDRDGPSPDGAVLTAAAWLNRLLPSATPAPPPSSPNGPEGVSRYYMGDLRPLDLAAHRTAEPPPIPKGDQSWNVNDQPGPYHVKADIPWWVVADFDWRGPIKTFEKWPTRSVGTFGWASDEASLTADWLLVKAVHVGPPSRDDSSTTKEYGKAAAGVLPQIGGVAMLALLAWFVLTQQQRR